MPKENKQTNFFSILKRKPPGHRFLKSQQNLVVFHQNAHPTDPSLPFTNSYIQLEAQNLL